MIIKVSEIENSVEGCLSTDFSEIIPDINKKEPVNAKINIEIQSSIIKVTGEIKAKAELKCDYCLEDFTKELNIKFKEFYTKENLNNEPGKEFEIKEDNFVQDLNGSDEIDLTDLIYQIIILNIPNQIVCGINCKGKENLKKYLKEEITDPRLEIFKTIKTDKE